MLSTAHSQAQTATSYPILCILGLASGPQSVACLVGTSIGGHGRKLTYAVPAIQRLRAAQLARGCKYRQGNLNSRLHTACCQSSTENCTRHVASRCSIESSWLDRAKSSSMPSELRSEGQCMARTAQMSLRCLLHASKHADECRRLTRHQEPRDTTHLSGN